jgi:hypothetical protein
MSFYSSLTYMCRAGAIRTDDSCIVLKVSQLILIKMLGMNVAILASFPHLHCGVILPKMTLNPCFSVVCV